MPVKSFYWSRTIGIFRLSWSRSPDDVAVTVPLAALAVRDKTNSYDAKSRSRVVGNDVRHFSSVCKH